MKARKCEESTFSAPIEVGASCNMFDTKPLGLLFLNK
jgi:hypothetical protein